MEEPNVKLGLQNILPNKTDTLCNTPGFQNGPQKPNDSSLLHSNPVFKKKNCLTEIDIFSPLNFEPREKTKKITHNSKMVEVEIKFEESGSYISASPEAPNSTEDVKNTVESIDVDASFCKKRPKREIELDFSLIKQEYKPRERRAVKRYSDILLAEAETRRKRTDNQTDIKKKSFIGDSTEDGLFCKICHQHFEEIRSLKIHIHNKHYKATEFTCALCSATMKSNAELMKHKLVHKGEERNFLCRTCKTAFSDHLEFLKHKVSHQKNFFCIECSKEFDNRTSYLVHIETHYYNMVECKVCHGQYNSNRINSHMITHKENNKSKCVECSKEYNKKDMAYHMTSHTGVKPYQCLYCGKGFGNQGQRSVHTRTHTGERPFKCNFCHRTFTQSIDKDRHLESHKKNMEKFECEVCAKKFLHKYSLDLHMDVHNNTQRYVCSICGLKVHTYTGLKSHMQRAHAREKMFKCIPCDIAFNTSSDLKKHTKLKKHLNNQYGYYKRNKNNSLA